MMTSSKDISVVIPLLNEEESLPELESWIRKVMEANQFSYEIIFIDDGSKDNSWKVIKGLSVANENIKAISFNRNYGKSAALNVGFKQAEGAVVITMDADLQDSPDEIPELYKMIQEDGFDIVSGWKKKRHDPLSKTIPTKLYNAVTRAMSGIKLNDFNCGLKAYKIDVVKSIEVYGEMHRYIPVIAKYAGFNKIGEKVVEHRARKYGHTKFGLNRFVNGPLDLLSIIFVGRFRQKPMHFFGALGIIFFLIGLAAVSILTIDVIYVKWFAGGEVRELTQNPSFFISLVALILGVQLFLAGLLGEMIQLNSRTHEYLVKDKI